MLRALARARNGADRIGVAVTAAAVAAAHDWDAAAAGDENPAAQVTFGIYGGDPKRIDLREIY